MTPQLAITARSWKFHAGKVLYFEFGRDWGGAEKHSNTHVMVIEKLQLVEENNLALQNTTQLNTLTYVNVLIYVHPRKAQQY